MLTKIITEILTTLENFETELIVRKGYVNSNEPLNLDVYHSRILEGKTLEEVGDKFNVERERVRQIEEKEYKQIEEFLCNINEKLSSYAQNLFKTLIVLIDDENYERIKPFVNIFDKFYMDNSINKTFSIDADNRILYSNLFDLKTIKTHLENKLEDDSYYSKEDLINLTSSVLDELNPDIDEKLKYAQILYKVLINKINEPKNKRKKTKDNNSTEKEIKHFVNFLEDDSCYYYSTSGVNIKSPRNMKDIKFSYWFKTLYPNGVHLPQQNEQVTKNSDKAKEIGLSNLKPLLNNIEELKDNSYRSIYNYITVKTKNKGNKKNKKFVSYDTGFFIHIDHIKELYRANKTFISNLAKEIYKLFDDEYNCIRVYSVFKSLENEFKNSGIITHELLFEILEISENKLFNYVNNKLLTKAGENPQNLTIKYEDNSLRYRKEECQGIKDFLSNNVFNSIINFNLENQLKKDGYTIDDLNREYENMDKETLKTETETIVKSRIGQDKLRKELLKKTHCCELCGINLEEILVASHIKPWRDSDNNEKLDVENVLLLCAMHDSLFDKGLISFDKNGKIIISKQLDENTQALLNIHEESQIDGVSERKAKYLEYHLSKHRSNFY